jgi:Golgi apparatus protein 1
MRATILALVLGTLVLLANAASDAPAPTKAAPAPKSSNIIPSAGQADLYGGIGDVSATGDCAGDAKALCKDVNSGDGRLAACLTKKVRAQRQGNTVGRKVSAKCVNALAAFKMDRSKMINKDVPLAKACKDDVAKVCKSVSDTSSPGAVLGCLKDNKPKLSAQCSAEVFRTQQEVGQYSLWAGVLSFNPIAEVAPCVRAGR